MQTTTKVTQRTAIANSGQQVPILSFSGDISSASKDAVLGAYRALNGAAAGKVLLNFSGVEYINSSGIAIIIELLLEAQKNGQRSVGLFGLTPHFQKVFTMVGITKYAALYPDEKASLAAL